MPDYQKILSMVTVALALLRELLLGSWRVLRFFLVALWRLPQRLNLAEKIFLGCMVASAVLLAGGWLGYTIRFQEEAALYHTMVTDDFFWFFVFHALAVAPVLLELVYPVCSSGELRLAFALRVLGLGGISIFYLLNFADPQRISPTTEASFTWNFYLFGIVNLASWASGVRGMVLYAQNSHSL